MRTLLIACGNPLRGDDGVAHEVLRSLEPAPDRELLSVQQLTPEIAAELARFERVVFLDADVSATTITIEPVSEALSSSPLSHWSSPAEIVALARGLYRFRGEALVCRITARMFG